MFFKPPFIYNIAAELVVEYMINVLYSVERGELECNYTKQFQYFFNDINMQNFLFFFISFKLLFKL